MLLLAAAAAALAAGRDPSFDTVVAPVLGTSCLQCHNLQNPSAGLDLTPFATQASLTSRRAGWQKILHKLEAGQMPPNGVSRPAGLDAMIAFLEQRVVFRAAAAKVDITPTEPQWLMGYAARQSKGVHDNIYHRVVALDSGEQQFYLAASDLCLFSPSLYAEAARELEKAFGIPPTQFWWSVTHTHSAPEVGPPDIYKLLLGRSDHEWDRVYTRRVIAALVEGVRTARERLQPARIAVGSGTSLANINRRAKDADGQVSLGLNPDGPVDHQFNLVRLETLDARPVALIVNYAMHGTVLGGQNLLISGDAPGTVSAYLEQKTGAPVLYVNGAAGDIAPIYSVYPDPRSGHLSQFKVLLGDRVLAALPNLGPGVSDVSLQPGEQIFETPHREDLAWPEERVRLPLRFLKLNDTLVWSAPVELFCEIAMEVRSRSPFAHTFYFGYTNGWLGYLPTAKAFAEGGYEPRTSPFTLRAEADLKQAVAAMLR